MGPVAQGSGEGEEISSKVAGMIYQGVVASQLLCERKTWVLPPLGLRALEGFHVEAARRLTGMRPKKVNGVWEYSHSADVLEATGLRTIADTIAKPRSNISKTIERRQVIKECREVERRRPLPPSPTHDVMGPGAEGDGKGGLYFAMNTGGGRGTNARMGTAAGLMDHHNRLRRQQAEQLGLALNCI